MRLQLLMIALASCGACVVPNMVLPTGVGAQTREDLNAPSRAEFVAVDAEDGSTLRGVWVPAAANAPIVLQLMEATVGATEARRTHGLFWDLPGAGYATLAFDYRGVAASGGERSSDHVRADAHTMWREAVARAGGDPTRVVLRGGSLGTLAIAMLLQDGARPGAVVLYGPVRSESVVRRFMVTGWAGTPKVPSGLAPWTAMFFRQPLAVDLTKEIARCSRPLLVICGAGDELLPIEEVEPLRAATEAAGGVFVLEDLGHVELCTRHHRLHGEERAFLSRALPVRVDVEARVRQMSAEMSAAGLSAPDAETQQRLRALLATRVDDPPRAVAALLGAGFSADRAARWLDANRLARNRWLGEREVAAVRGLADAATPADDPILIELVDRVWGANLPRRFELIGWEVHGTTPGLTLQLRFESAADPASARLLTAVPCRDLAELLTQRNPGGDGSAQLKRLVRVAAAMLPAADAAAAALK